MIDVELVFIAADAEFFSTLRLDGNATVADAIAAAELAASHPQLRFDEMPVGIWGRLTTHKQRLKDGDRVEVYRALEIDPMEARRIRALD
jgi:putative ubiquitin-RnfH superfamily antitoxin RatB of RatAB toxin-antitoxin module